MVCDGERFVGIATIEAVLAAPDNATVASQMDREAPVVAPGVAARITDVPVTTAVLRGRPRPLILEVLRSGHDLLVRTHDREIAERGKPFGAIDLELLRQCPCPVWQAGPPATRPNKR